MLDARRPFFFNEREDGCGACAKPRSEQFCTGSTPSSVARRTTHPAELVWPSVEIESPNRFQSYLGFVPSTSSSRLLVCEPAHSSTRLSSGSVGTVLIRLCGRDVLRVPISSGWRPSPDRRHPLPIDIDEALRFQPAAAPIHSPRNPTPLAVICSVPPCGWCKDRWGLSWQITPRAPTEALAVGGGGATRAFEAMMSMKKDRHRHHRGRAAGLSRHDRCPI